MPGEFSVCVRHVIAQFKGFHPFLAGVYTEFTHDLFEHLVHVTHPEMLLTLQPHCFLSHEPSQTHLNSFQISESALLTFGNSLFQLLLHMSAETTGVALTCMKLQLCV